MKHWFWAALALGIFLIPHSVLALTKADRKQIKQELKEGRKLYLRIDAPCATGRHPYGTYKRPLVEVSPEGVNTEADSVMNAGWWHSDSTYWAVRVNDPVEISDLDIESDDGEVEIEFEGVDQADGEDSVVLLVNIETLEDFHAAFEQAFSDQPLQEEHDDWSAEIKQKIADRQLEAGMNKRQVYYITGRPEEVTKSKDGEADIETWKLRRDKGIKTGFWTVKSKKEDTGLPETVRFRNGTLEEIGPSGDQFSLDD